MKRWLIVAMGVFILVNMLPAEAAVNTIYDYLRKIDDNYYAVVGFAGKSGDSLAATDVVVALKRHLNRDIEPVYENLINPNVNKILIGHPCDNKLIKELSCEQWPYDESVAVIKIVGNDLVLAGSTVDDTRRAGKVIANFKEFPLLKKHKQVLVIGTTLELDDLELHPVKNPWEFICGDNLCEIGEKYLCPADCQHVNCFMLCQVNKFAAAACRDPASNPNVPSCLEAESNKGAGYCGEGKVCCCKEFAQQEKSIREEHPEVKERRSVWSIVWNWIKELFSVMF